MGIRKRVLPDDVRRDLDARSKRALARRLPWPYNGMVSDITSAVQKCSNYLAATGLICYTEACGRQLFRNGKAGDNFECFKAFLAYIGASEVLQWPLRLNGKELKFYEAIRNGLVHAYFAQAERGGVALTTRSKEGQQTGFVRRGDAEFWIAVVPYLNLFSNALEKAQAERLLEQGWKR